MRTRGPSDSRFTFTTQEAGDHAICLSTTSGSSWSTNTHIRLYLDIVVGSTKPDREQDRSHVTELSSKLRDLNQKLDDVRREQQYQREREAKFRDLSEITNARAVWYSIAQIVVIVATCTWQLRHLKVRPLNISLSRSPNDCWYSVSSRIRRCNDTLPSCSVAGRAILALQGRNE